MNVEYKGMSQRYDVRQAIVNYDEDDQRECKDIKRMIQLLDIKGWNIDHGVAGMLLVEVESRREYDRAFMPTYKDIRSSIRLFNKFGI